MPSVRNTYRDRLFTFIFGSEEHRDWTLDLYNAMNGTHYDNPDDIEITTIKEVLYLGMHNDVSFLLTGEMNLYEQQSTYNPNMPLRMLQYAGSLYEKHLALNKISKYGEALIELPPARLVVFYNGTRPVEDDSVLHLSDSFPEGAESDIEVRVRMLNVNKDHSPGLMQDCQPLCEYAWTVDAIRDKISRKGREARLAAIDEVIVEMPDDFVIKPYLQAHKAEVRDMLLTEYNEAEEMELYRMSCRKTALAEGLAEGRAEGRAEGLRDDLVRMMRNLKLTPQEAMDALEVPAADREKLTIELQQSQ